MTIIRTYSPARRVTASFRRTAAAAGIYVGAWLAGLAVAPASPAPDTAAGEIARFYLDNASAVLASSALVHGVAGVALGVFAWTLTQTVRVEGGLRRAVIGIGLTASGLSLAQVAIAGAAIAFADSNARTTAELFHGLNLVDVLKIAMLAGFVHVATSAAMRFHPLPRWLRLLAGALVPTLVVGSAALVVSSTALSAVLAASLVGLLVWAASIAFVLRRARR